MRQFSAPEPNPDRWRRTFGGQGPDRDSGQGTTSVQVWVRAAASGVTTALAVSQRRGVRGRRL